MPVSPREWKKGEPLDRNRLNENTKGIQQGLKVGADMESRTVGKSKSLNPVDTTKPNTNESIRKYKITALQEDYYECVSYNESSDTAGTTTIYVAKPLEDRASYYDGETITYPDGDSITYTKDATNPEWKRQADPGGGNVDQELIPNPRVGEVIRAFKTNTSVTIGGSTPVAWEEISKRVWAEI